MERVTVDFSDVEEFSPVDKGEYPVLIEKATWVDPEVEDKFPYINLDLKITEGEFKDRHVFTVLSLSPKALWRTKQTLENLGLFQENLDIDYDEDTLVVTSPELVGLPAVATVSKGKYEGRDTNNVEALVSADTPRAGTKRGGKSAPKAAAKQTGKKRTFK